MLGISKMDAWIVYTVQYVWVSWFEKKTDVKVAMLL